MGEKVEMNSFTTSGSMTGNRPSRANGGANQNAMVPTEVKLLNPDNKDEREQWTGKILTKIRFQNNSGKAYFQPRK